MVVNLRGNMRFFNSEEYQAFNEKLFLRYKSKIEEVLPDVRVEHIGASAIPTAISKGDLDIFVGVEAFELERVVQLLVTLGFQEKVDTLRTPDLCMLEAISNEEVAIQVVSNGSEFEFFLIFRDKLRSNMSLVQQYNELKLSCEGLSQDAYRLKKSAFIEQVLGYR